MNRMQCSLSRPAAFAMSRLVRCTFSSQVDTLPAMSRDYLTKWLGKDMAGSSYHERVVKASRATSDAEAAAPMVAMATESTTTDMSQVAAATTLEATTANSTVQHIDNSAPSSSSKNVNTEVAAEKEHTMSAPVAAAPAASHSPAMVYHGTVRSGQQIYAERRSLVILGSVNNGAEVLSDGDIHVYGSLLGRAVAGLGGSSEAHIFARSFGASLVGISDAFIAPDDCTNLQGIEGKEAFVRMLKNGESTADLRGTGAVVVDCGSGNSLVLTPM
jgi:septum site-determining protein MinC